VPRTSIVGTWELESIYGSDLGKHTYPLGNGTLFKFTDSGFEEFSGGAKGIGTYVIEKDSFHANGYNMDRITLYRSNVPPGGLGFKIENQKLTFNVDGYYITVYHFIK